MNSTQEMGDCVVNQQKFKAIVLINLLFTSPVRDEEVFLPIWFERILYIKSLWD